MTSVVPDRANGDLPLPEEMAGAVLTINLDALRSNYRLLREMAAPARCAAVVKANGYGLGADLVAHTLEAEGCHDFFVAYVAEGLRLRRHLLANSTIYVLHSVPPGTEQLAADHGLTPVLNTLEQVAAWQRQGRRSRRPLPAILQVDSGMSRAGLSPEDIEVVAAEPERLAGIAWVGTMSHLACSDAPDNSGNAHQLAAFRAARKRLATLAGGPGTAPASLAASSGIFLGRDYHFDLVRPGAALYGINPCPGRPSPMQPVVRLDARILQCRQVPAGTVVGYGHAWTAARPSRLATVSVGYADNFPRSGSGCGSAFVGGVEAPFAGRISMDMLTLDITDVPAAAVEAEFPVEIIGPNRPLDAVAEASGTIAYELLTGLSRRYHRRIVDSREDTCRALVHLQQQPHRHRRRAYNSPVSLYAILQLGGLLSCDTIYRPWKQPTFGRWAPIMVATAFCVPFFFLHLIRLPISNYSGNLCSISTVASIIIYLCVGILVELIIEAIPSITSYPVEPPAEEAKRDALSQNMSLDAI
ncbi:hypothetical protein NKR23_g12352 [Pleurostoma richardsiae]|uniref:Alanine racemase C-terminal domain-containing protein n=1 Tax=Pleurostoma richardsiae TaxID=41990 RepID=A0AA38VCW0_9PEZI|nr:hypothetical protein NKR23_g12352 [Pleurostoma richardsiae]